MLTMLSIICIIGLLTDMDAPAIIKVRPFIIQTFAVIITSLRRLISRTIPFGLFAM